MSETIKEIVYKTIRQRPVIEGPIPVTEDSQPFSSMAYAREPLDLGAYGYSEEEYFMAGRANVYEGKKELRIYQRDLAYKTRFMVRKPSPEKFSGRVYLDIYNASTGYDIEDVWKRSYQYYMGNEHIYIGMTAKPVNVASLKHFDYDRYKNLKWTVKDSVPLPDKPHPFKSIKGIEEGLVWDMLSQLGNLIKSDQASFLQGYDAKELYLTGQSQSGAYLNTYVYFFHSYLEEIFDGFLTVAGAGKMRDLRQNERRLSLVGMRDQIIADVKIPDILLSSHGDINLFKSETAILRSLAEDYPMIRHYELASSPHTDPTSPLIPANSEVAKTHSEERLLDGEYDYEVNSIQLAYYVNSCLEFLHDWAIEGKEPPESAMIDRDSADKPLEDEYGNGLAGLRSPYVDVPIASYKPNETVQVSKLKLDIGVNGSMKYLSQAQLNDLYTSKEDYLSKFKAAVYKQQEEGWLLESDAKRMVRWAEDAARKIF